MNADAGFRIGKTHSVCQDYAAVSPNTGRCIAALSDGCSTAPQTDVGARILVLSALSEWKTAGDIGAVINRASRLARGWSGVDLDCLKGTLAVIYKSDGLARAELYGDGIIFGVDISGMVETIEASYSGNAPAYPAYPVLGLSALDVAAKVEAQSGESWRMTRRVTTQGGPVDVSVHEVTRILAPSAVREFAGGWSVVGVISDGAHSFYRVVKTTTSRVVEPVPFSEIAPQLLNFGTLDGPFVVSRLKHFSAWCEKAGIYHADDLSMAAIALPESR